MNVTGAFVSPIGNMTHLYSPYWVRNAVFGISSLAIWHRERLLLLDPAYPWTDYSSSAWTLLVHLSVPLATRPINIAHTGLGMLSLVHFPWLYGTTSNRCKDPMLWRTLHSPVGPLNLCGMAVGTNPSLWSCWELGSPCKSVVIHLAFWQMGWVLPMVMTRVLLLQPLIVLLSTSWWVIVPKNYIGT